MQENQYHSFIHEFNRITTRLDKIVELLEFRNSIEVARDQMRDGTVSLLCNCSRHKRGESTAGWDCPVHGQQF